MSRNYYSEIYLHIVWHTKESAPMLNPRIEPQAFEAIRQKMRSSFKEVILFEIGGTPTHLHVAVNIPPTILISDFIGQVKGASSHEVNQQRGDDCKPLEWQTGYGVVSFGKKDLTWVCDYIKNQKEHHAVGKAHRRLEVITHFDDVAPG